MTPSSKTPVRNHQCPPSLNIEDWGSLTHFYSCKGAEIRHKSKESHIMMTHDVKDDPILQGPSQELSTSSKYGLPGQGFLTLQIMLKGRNFAHKWTIIYYDHPWCQGWPHPSRPQSGTINILQVWTLRMRGSWHTSDHARELKFDTQVKIHILWRSNLSRISWSTKIHPPSTWSGTINVLHV